MLLSLIADVDLVCQLGALMLGVRPLCGACVARGLCCLCLNTSCLVPGVVCCCCCCRYDGTVRNSAGDVVQFLYGEDGMDGVRIEGQVS